MRRNIYLIAVLWLLAGGICGVRYQITHRNAEERITRTEAEEMVRDAREETRVEVLKEVDEKQAKEAAENAATADGDSGETVAIAGGDSGETSKTQKDGETAAPRGQEPESTEQDQTKGTVQEDDKDAVSTTLDQTVVKNTYYKATVNGVSNLRIRDGASNLSAELASVKEGTTGYVIKRDDSWTLLAIDGWIGYMSTQYLLIEEIDEKDYPEELLSLSEVNAGQATKVE